eukprot:TRINITY_DN2334_c0_g2_i5.p1 TRINITY_DN2334_c0_g2~~TRINITY_DN2334_c0_g2_i5.p1  ORF type:complete len:107 (+),score=38.55 TRINITY_DN2334_c0_g2_i5:258-578(+)
MGTKGARDALIVGFDSVMMKFYKKMDKEKWERMQMNEKENVVLLRIPTRQIIRVEYAICDQSKIYLWYTNNAERRIDLKFKKQSDAAEVKNKLLYILKMLRSMKLI